MSMNQTYENVDDFLSHFGVKGMRWGVRKNDSSSSLPNFQNDGVTARADGSISIQPGANLQRLVRSSGKSLPMKDITYASINQYDNAKYVKAIGGKGFFGGGRDQILSIQATKKIEAPSKEEATRIVSDLMINNASFRKKNTNMLGEVINAKELAKIKADPSGKTAQSWYEMTNTKMTFDKDFDPDAPAVQKMLRESMALKGYNALRDENDVSAGIAKAPIIIFNPQDSLKVTSMTQITDEIRQANKTQLKEYRRLGKNYVEQQLYG